MPNNNASFENPASWYHAKPALSKRSKRKQFFFYFQGILAKSPTAAQNTAPWATDVKICLNSFDFASFPRRIYGL